MPLAISESKKAEILRLLKENKLSGCKIAKQTGVSVTSVVKMRTKHNLPVSPTKHRRIAPELEERIRRLILQGMDMQKIAKKCKTNLGPITRVLKQLHSHASQVHTVDVGPEKTEIIRQQLLSGKSYDFAAITAGVTAMEAFQVALQNDIPSTHKPPVNYKDAARAEKARQLLLQGKPVKEVITATGYTYPTICKMRDSLGIIPAPGRKLMDPEKKRLVLKLLSEGLDSTDIMVETGVSSTTICKLRRDYGYDKLQQVNEGANDNGTGQTKQRDLPATNTNAKNADHAIKTAPKSASKSASKSKNATQPPAITPTTTNPNSNSFPAVFYPSNAYPGPIFPGSMYPAPMYPPHMHPPLMATPSMYPPALYPANFQGVPAAFYYNVPPPGTFGQANGFPVTKQSEIASIHPATKKVKQKAKSKAKVKQNVEPEPEKQRILPPRASRPTSRMLRESLSPELTDDSDD
ncbi:hypothetical protein BC940DRAFT_290784 [Gongronella butleri]|nr:hypothetical protein BC940DRAFT_290784 [Gongronella butleri]